ncbi:MAG TPA: GntR family transcriptional regulator, partial [Pyrinomonadaceae bacterium]|nr:GntR family transcriptional regulator [Pyrinomonadaceae bacterium]
MKFWITKNSEVTVHEQIVTQVRVGITTGDLRPGDRMPSAREVARRFGIHANTVTAAYRELAASGDIE